MPRARALFAVLAAALVLFGGRGALAQDETSPAEPRDLVVLFGDVTIHRGEEAGEIVVLHGSVDVSGVARGDVVVVDGRIEVTGQVSGSVVSMNGPVEIGPNAQILGDVLARDGVSIEPGARIDGEVHEGTAFTYRTPIDALGRWSRWVTVVASTLALGLVVLLFAPRGAEAVAVATGAAPFRSAGIGAAALVLLPVIGVVAVVSLVGLPFGLALLFALLLIFSIGFTLSAFALGRAIWRAPRTRWLAFGIGWVLVSGLLAIPVAGGMVWFVGSVYGTGAMTVATWRARRDDGPPRARPAGGRHRPSGKMPPVEVKEPALEPMVTERAMGEEGAGL